MLVLIKCVWFVVKFVSVVVSVSIVVKMKRVNSSNMSDICNKLNLTKNFMEVTQLTQNYQNKKTHLTICDTCNIIVLKTFC